MKKLLRPVALSLIWVFVGLSCKKEAAPQYSSCRDGTCCGKAKGVLYDFDEVVEGELGMIGGPPYGTWGIRFDRQVPRNYTLTKSIGGAICALSLDKVESYVTRYRDPSDTTFRPNCRVWGRIYTGTEMPTLVVGPPRFVYVDRIEFL